MENVINLSIKSLSSDEINRIEEFRKAKQTAILTILFSDIVNSSLATEKLGENTFARLRHIHDELFRQIMTRDNAGLIIKEIGDSFLCVFAEPAMAVKRSIEFQKAIYANKENLSSNGYCLTVRIGIHLGQVAIENNLATDIFGKHVNRAARIQSIANGGQILCSNSVWENANELLNENKDEKILGIRYGRVKLKGIPEKGNIYGFYSNELPIPKAPEIVVQRKRKNILLSVTVCVLIIAAITFLYNWNNNHKIESNSFGVNQKKIYYVQFDFSDFKNSDSKKQTDTVLLEERLLAKVITAFFPDSLVTEKSVKESYNKKGVIYKRHLVFDAWFFRDTLKYNGVIFLKLLKRTVPDNDSVKLKIDMVECDSNGDISLTSNEVTFDMINLGQEVTNYILTNRISDKIYDIQARVLSSNDSIILFKLEKYSSLSKGAEIYIKREFNLKEDFKSWSSFSKLKLLYYKKTGDKLKYKKALEVFESDSINLSKSSSVGISFAEGIVLDIYDSTGKAKWYFNNSQPPIYFPIKGDEIYFKH